MSVKTGERPAPFTPVHLPAVKVNARAAPYGCPCAFTPFNPAFRERNQHMTAPQRVQLRRIKGWRKPEGAISVARPHNWGNPFVVGQHGISSNADAVELYWMWLPGQALYGQLSELTGHDLMCFCALDQPCHADVLLELANS